MSGAEFVPRHDPDVGAIGAQLNLGPISGAWLRAVGIAGVDDLRRVGVEEAFALVHGHGFNASALLLYALEGALSGIHWNAIPEERKRELRAFAVTCRGQARQSIKRVRRR